MSELLDFYQEQAKAGLSTTTPWLAALQTNALRDFNRYGFPTRNNENWKYTLLDKFIKQRFVQTEKKAKSVPIGMSDLPIGLPIVIHNGHVIDNAELAASLPGGVIVQPLLTALSLHADKIKPYLSQLLHTEHGFHALNTAALQTGLLIYLPAGACIETPLVLNHWQDKDNQATHVRHLIIAEEGSQATIIERYAGEEGRCYFTNTITEACLAKHAKITHYKIQCESKMAFHVGHIAVRQAFSSQFNSHSLSIGGALVRSDMIIELQEEQAECLMNGVYLPGDKQHVDHHTTVQHLVPNCRSNQDYKGVLTGQSRAVFNGKIVVAKDAQHTKAYQQNKNLILSAMAEIDTKPQLEIFADDVICSHGATVGQLDEEALFYLATRGIGEKEAKKYLIQAFAAENLSLIPHPEMVTWMANLINQQMG